MTVQTPIEFSEYVSTMTESEFVVLWQEACVRFGNVGVFFGRSDVNDALDGQEPLTDEEWDLVQDSYSWRRAIPDILTERGWGLVDVVISDALDREASE